MVKLQRRHYEYVASILLAMKARFDLTDDQHSAIVNYMADNLSATNPQFNYQRFYDKARGVKTITRRKSRWERQEEAEATTAAALAEFWE